VHIAERVPELRAVIEAIRDNPRGFLKRLPRERCPERYKAWRAILQGGDWKGIDPLTRTVMWFFIKKNAHRAHAGWSGYFGDPSRPNGCYIFDRIAAQVNFFSPLLQGTTLYSDFRDLPTPKAGDFVFLDPPYTGSDNRACYGMTEVENDETMTLAQDAHDWVVGSKANFLFINRFSPELLDWVGDRNGLLRKRRSLSSRLGSSGPATASPPRKSRGSIRAGSKTILSFTSPVPVGRQRDGHNLTKPPGYISPRPGGQVQEVAPECTSRWGSSHRSKCASTRGAAQ